MNEIQAQRLLNVAKALREAPRPEAFTMQYYINPRDERRPEKEDTLCGTPACALGHYAARTDLQDLLEIQVVRAVNQFFDRTVMTYRGIPYSRPCYDSGKVMEHFGLSFRGVSEIFAEDGCEDAHTALGAAEYIERFVQRLRDNPDNLAHEDPFLGDNTDAG